MTREKDEKEIKRFSGKNAKPNKELGRIETPISEIIQI